MSVSADIDALIHACYAAAAEPNQWPRVLDRLSAAVGALGIVITNIAQPTELIASETLQEANEDYAAGWWRFDTRNARGRAARVSPGIIVLDRDLVTPEEKRRDAFFQEFCRPHGLGEFAGYVASDASGGSLSVSAFRRDRDGDYHAGGIELLRRLAPHAARAYALSVLLADARAATGDAHVALERLQAGAIILDTQGYVRQMNVVAEQLLPGYLRVSADRGLHAVVIAEQDKFKRALASGLDVRDGAAASILLRGSHSRYPIAVEVTPLRKGNEALVLPGLKHGGALILLRDLLKPPAGSIEPHLRQLGLTQAEARVAMLVGRGQNLRDVAEFLSITENTIRAQLKSIFAKLSINRQSQLSLLVARLDVAR